MSEKETVEQSTEISEDNQEERVAATVASHACDGQDATSPLDPMMFAVDSANSEEVVNEEGFKENPGKTGTFRVVEEVYRAYQALRADYTKKSQENSMLKKELEGLRKDGKGCDIAPPAPTLIGGRGAPAAAASVKTMSDSDKFAISYFTSKIK